MAFPFNTNQKKINTPPARNNKFMVKILKISQRNVYILLLFSIIVFITSCAPLTQFTQTSKLIGPSKDSKSSKPKIELFVMSQCPYAVEAEKIIVPVIKELKAKIDFTICFIAEENNKNAQEKFSQPPSEIPGEIEEQGMDQCSGEFISEGGKFKSLHGKSEIDENIRQVVMAKYYPDKYLDYLLLRSDNYATDNWEECATKAWMDCKFISRIAQSEEGEMLFRQNFTRSNELGINASPTLLINGKRYKGQIAQIGINRIICKEGPTNQYCKSIPVCGTDSDCVAEGKVGICIDPDTPQATCKFTDPVHFTLTIIKPKECPACNPDQLVKMIKELFPGAQIEELASDSIKADKLINDLTIKELPALYFDQDITKTARYAKIKDRLSATKTGFLLDPQYIHISYLLDRNEKKGDTKLFVESMSPGAIATENFLIKDRFFKEANIKIHYIASKVNSQSKTEAKILTIKRDRDNPGVLHLRPQQEKVIFKSPKGLKEIQENIRQICINKYYPDQHLDYLSCINKGLGKNEGTIDWRQCLVGEKIDHQKIDSCTNGKEGMNLLLKDIALIEELGISLCPTYLINDKILLKGIDPLSFKRIYAELMEGVNNGGD